MLMESVDSAEQSHAVHSWDHYLQAFCPSTASLAVVFKLSPQRASSVLHVLFMYVLCMSYLRIIIRIIQGIKSDPGSYFTMTFSLATRLFSRLNSGESYSPSCDLRVLCSAAAWKSLDCDATF